MDENVKKEVTTAPKRWTPISMGPVTPGLKGIYMNKDHLSIHCFQSSFHRDSSSRPETDESHLVRDQDCMADGVRAPSDVMENTWPSPRNPNRISQRPNYLISERFWAPPRDSNMYVTPLHAPHQELLYGFALP
ncbi:hypothetical protein TNCV_3931621 [Trichonephila clavipes]|nr:hypothetical protein TNCV_3931621 [Trichonephila clavipes]